MTVIGTLAIVVAIAFFSLTGSGLGTDLLLSTGGFELSMLVVGLLTKSPRYGALLAALVLVALIAGCLVLVLTRPVWLIASIGKGTGRVRFVSGLVASLAGASLARLLSLLNVPGSRESQPSRRRV
jgi:hypothetical protein